MQKPSKLSSPLVNEFPYSGIDVVTLSRRLGVSNPCFIWEGAGVRTRDSELTLHSQGRYSYIGLSAASAMVLTRDVIAFSSGTVTNRTAVSDSERSPFHYLGKFLGLDDPAVSTSLDPSLPPFQGGAVGFIAHDLARYYENIEGLVPAFVEPDLHFVVPETFLCIDREREILLLIAPADRGTGRISPELSQKHASWCRKLEQEDLSAPITEHTIEISSAVVSEKFSKAKYMNLVTRAQEYIRAGDVYQLVLANTFSVAKSSSLDSVELYAKQKTLNPSPYHFYFPFADGKALIGASPEVMLRSIPSPSESSAPRIMMRLVAGTYPREFSLDADLAAIERLRSNEKERAEHVMLVDHARNDIGKVASFGSVVVQDLLSVETYPKVHHLVSEVSGQLRSDRGILDALQSCHPICTLTGTPKIRAMEIIAELEGPSRGVFGGTAAMIGYDGSIDSSVIIRSIVCDKTHAEVKAGAGIVIDSDPEREYYECHWKAQSALNALGVQVQ